MTLYKKIELEEGVPVIYVGVHAVKWNHEWGIPTIGFIEAEEESPWGGMCREGNHIETIVQLRAERDLLDEKLSHLSCEAGELRDSHKKLEGELAYQEETVLPKLRYNQSGLLKENRILTDALYKESIRTVEAFALIMKVLEADETDQWDALDMEPFVKWIENFPKETK